MINIKLKGYQCYLINSIIEEHLINMDPSCPFKVEIEDIFIEFYIQWLSQDPQLHEMLLRHE